MGTMPPEWYEGSVVVWSWLIVCWWSSWLWPEDPVPVNVLNVL